MDAGAIAALATSFLRSTRTADGTDFVLLNTVDQRCSAQQLVRSFILPKVLAGEPAMFQPLPPETALPLEGLGTALRR